MRGGVAGVTGDSHKFTVELSVVVMQAILDNRRHSALYAVASLDAFKLARGCALHREGLVSIRRPICGEALLAI